MQIGTRHTGDTLTLVLAGRLDATTASLLGQALVPRLEGVRHLVVDFDAQDMEEGGEGVVFIPADGAYTEPGLAKVESMEPGKLSPEEIALLEPFWEN